MVLLICLDNRNGISFHQRRQSADRCVYEKILALTGERPLWIRPYSEKKFPKDRVSVVADFSGVSDPDAWCFAEDDSFLPILDRFDRVIVYRWNRDYPSDVVFPKNCLDMYRISATTDFPGNSHKVITQEVYDK